MNEKIRAFKSEIDLLAVLEIEAESFGDGFSGPVFFHFAQAVGPMFRLYVRDDAVVAYCIMAPSVPEPDVVWLVSMGVLPKQQNTGIGKALIEHFCRRTELKGKTIRLTVKEANHRAIRFYESCAFIFAGTDTEIYKDRVTRLIYTRSVR